MSSVGKRQKMVHSSNALNLYKVPLHGILKNRRSFYGLRKECGESINRWLKRVQLCIGYCEFPAIIIEFLLIDRFTCELNANELKAIQGVDTLTLKELIEHYFEGQSIEIATTNENAAAVEIGQNQSIDSCVNIESVSLSQILGQR